MSHLSIPELLSLLERANNIASTSQLDDLLEQMLDLMLEVCGAESGTLYLLDEAAGELIFRLVRGDTSSKLKGARIPKDVGIVGATLQERRPLEVVDIVDDPRWYRGPSEMAARRVRKVVSFPLLLRGEPTGVVQLFNYKWPELQIVQLLGNRMAAEVEQANLLCASRAYNQRLEALVDIVGHIGSSLNHDHILQMIIEYACLLLGVEASSLFLVDEASGDLVLSMAAKSQKANVAGARVPAGKGIIGYVVQTGETVLVPDVSKDERYYGSVDRASGFDTRSILAVPLRTRTINLGKERGPTTERIIGGLEALNKVAGAFTQEDVRLLETLANQAATVLQIAELYSNTNEQFFDVIRVISAAVDAKDPYTEGHSQRVSDFAVAIARELALPNEMLHHVRIAGLLHDVGKIGISDAVLHKPGTLTVEEFTEMKKHPEIGAKIMGRVRMLKTEVAGIAEHHEKLDGTGYPRGIKEDEITSIGRIIAVADVFDALTSDRPYREGMDVERAFQHMIANIGLHLDNECVYALIRAYARDNIHTQREKELLNNRFAA